MPLNFHGSMDGSRVTEPLRVSTVGTVVGTVLDSTKSLPPPPNMWGFRHVGMYVSYLCVGFIYGSALSFVYPIIVILHQKPNNFQAAVSNGFTLFWSFKVFFGWITDNVPMFGYRRKPYLLIGWGMAIASSVVLATIATLNGNVSICVDGAGDSSTPGDDGVCPDAFSIKKEVTDLSVSTLIIWMLVNNFGYVMADVAMDSMAIDMAKREALEDRGAIQANCYTIRSLGFMVSTAITSFGLNGPAYGGTFPDSIPITTLLWIVVGLQCFGLPFWLALQEDKINPGTDLLESETEVAESSFSKMWELLHNSAFSKLMIFNVFMNASQCIIVNARNSVLARWVGMAPLTQGADSIIGYILQAITLYCAGRWWKNYNWRGLLIFGTLYFVFFLFAFWLVIFDVGPFRNQWFVVLIDADQTFAQSVGYLVAMWACVEMAPAGIEGTTLALTTTIGNAGQSIGSYVTIAFNAIFALSQADLLTNLDGSPCTPKPGEHCAGSQDTRMQYMYNAIAVMICQFAFMLFFAWMPTSMTNSSERYLKKETSSNMRVWAVILVIFAVTWGSGTTIAAMICPDNSIVGGDGGVLVCTVS